MKKTVLFLLASVLAIFVSGQALAAGDFNKTSYTAKEVEFRTTMREIFAQNLTWQRAVLLETIGNGRDASKARERLVQSQDSITSLFRPYIGDSATDRLISLLKQQAQLLADYAGVVYSRGDKVFSANRLREKNDEIAMLLARENMNWDKAEIFNKIQRYTDLVTAEADLQENNFGAFDPPAIDSSFYMAMDLADTFTAGIMKLEPGMFW